MCCISELCDVEIMYLLVYLVYYRSIVDNSDFESLLFRIIILGEK